MKNTEINNNLTEILNLLNLKDFEKADLLFRTIRSNLKIEIKIYLESLFFFFKKDYLNSIKLLNDSLNINKNYLPTYLYLADSYDRIGELVKSENILKTALILKQDSDIINNSLGFNYYKQNKLDKSILFFQKAIELNNDNYKAYFNMANSYIKKKDYTNAIKNFKKTIEINRNCPDIYFNLAEAFKKNENYNDSIYNFKLALQDKITWLRREKIIAKIMELYLITNQNNEYKKYINTLSIKFPDNRRIAATSVFISSQLNIINPHPFCPNPLEFIYKNSLDKFTDNYKKFQNLLMKEIDSLDFKWEPSGKTTRNGYGTTENLSEKKLPIFIEFEEMILKELKNYFNLHKSENIGFIKNWPEKVKFQSWSNRLKKQGFNITHIHPSGWISGVFYLKIPKNISGDEAGIEFSLHGDEYFIKNKKNIDSLRLNPKEGEIIFFPSSLFHSTIPFESDEERICIAFDICKI